MIAPVALVLAGCSGASPTAPTDAPTFQIAGRVADANTRLAIPGVTLSAVDGPNAGKIATSSSDGRYTLTPLLTGTFRLRAQRDGYEDHLQDVTVTNHTNIDFVMIPGRSLSSGWAAGSFFAAVDGARVGARITHAEVDQSGNTLSGSFTAADGSSGSFSGTLAATQFSGSFRVDLVTPGGRCRGTATGAVGNATPGNISLIASVMTPENCGSSVTNLALTLTP
jgi:hypothetical protein